MGNAGLLLTRVQYLKHDEEKNFAVFDAAMNDLMRPALYGAWQSAGAYGFTMCSNYNSRPRVAEIMVDGSKHQVVRQRETIEQLFANESILDS